MVAWNNHQGIVSCFSQVYMITEEILEELIEEANVRVVNRYIEMRCEQHDIRHGRKLAKERLVWSGVVLVLLITIIYLL